MLTVISHSEEETIYLGRRIATLLKPGDIICLFGSLGAGKTVLVRGIASGMGIDKSSVISPSFVLIREYLPKGKARNPVYHIDLFRLKTRYDILRLGIDEYFYSSGVCIIEWAERLGGLLPPQFLRIELQISDTTERLIKLIAEGQRYRKMVYSLTEDYMHSAVSLKTRGIKKSRHI